MNPLYDYVFEIANRMYPTWDTDINDEQYQTDSFRGWDFVHQLEDERLEFSITKERYLENAPIIRSLRAMGLDTEKFWMAMLFVYDVVRERTENVQQVPTSVFEEFRAFARYLQENPDANMARARARRNPWILPCKTGVGQVARWQRGRTLCQVVKHPFFRIGRIFGESQKLLQDNACHQVFFAAFGKVQRGR